MYSQVFVSHPERLPESLDDHCAGTGVAQLVCKREPGSGTRGGGQIMHLGLLTQVSVSPLAFLFSALSETSPVSLCLLQLVCIN